MDGDLLNSQARGAEAPSTDELWVDRVCDMIDRLMQENDQLRGQLKQLQPVAQRIGLIEPVFQSLQAELKQLRGHAAYTRVTEDYNAEDKTRRAVDRIVNFGEADFAELACCLFASSLTNHRIVHQRLDEGSLLWRAVKMSGGPVLELGRAAGGSTLVLLGASGTRRVVSIDRAPFHSWLSEHVFMRPDVAPRLKLYRQTSREPIAETEFGMMFIDADHSYEGVCNDIATYWNQLKSFDGRPPLAVFHDAADNPIAHVPPVKRACDELLAETGVARFVESWGSMLAVEKLADLDQDRWYAKELSDYWQRYATPQYPILRPAVIRGRLHPDRPPTRLGAVNLLGEDNVDGDSWMKPGMTVELPPDMTTDSAIRLLRETSETAQHGVEKVIALPVTRFNFCVYVRPHRLETIRVSVSDGQGTAIVQADFCLGANSRIGRIFATDGCEVSDASFLYRNGYFACNLAAMLPAPLRSACFAVNALDAAGSGMHYDGNRDRGFFINLASVREVL